LSTFKCELKSTLEVYEVSGRDLPKGRIQVIDGKITGVFVDPPYAEGMRRALLDFLMKHRSVHYEGKMEILGDISSNRQWSPTSR